MEGSTTEKKVINPETAKQDVERWLTYKKVSEKKRTNYRDAIEELEEAVAAGRLTIAENCEITQKLIFPIEDKTGNPFLEELTFTPRINVMELNKHTKTVKPTDTDGRIAAYMAALTKQSAGILGKMDTEDHAIASNIVVFFL